MPSNLPLSQSFFRLDWYRSQPRVYNTSRESLRGSFRSRGSCKARPNAPSRDGRQAMDCDQVFMILTRGPFPTGEAWDEQVEAHLETCADCWRLAEALRPALELFQEAIPPSESRELPGYWGDARPAATVVSELSQSAARIALSTRVRRLAR